MVNIFGNEPVRGRKGDRGPSGPRGRPGQKGDAGSIEDSCMWVGNSVLKSLERYDDKGCFFIDDLSNDIELDDEKNIVTWISRTMMHEKKNLIAARPAKHISEELINDRYALMFDGTTRYCSEELGLFQVDPGNCFGFLCMTFRTSSDDKDQVLLSTFQAKQNPYTEISISGVEKKIFITSKKETKNTISIGCDVKQWTTLYVEYKGHESKQTKYNYIVKCGDSEIVTGTFSLNYDNLAKFGFAMGSRYDNTGFLKGKISSLEIYHVNETSKPFPECLKNLIINNHVIKEEDNPPTSKKSRVI